MSGGQWSLWTSLTTILMNDIFVSQFEAWKLLALLIWHEQSKSSIISHSKSSRLAEQIQIRIPCFQKVCRKPNPDKKSSNNALVSQNTCRALRCFPPEYACKNIYIFSKNSEQIVRRAYYCNPTRSFESNKFYKKRSGLWKEELAGEWKEIHTKL
jgi:hypothetical protein